jgi:hypothetical protein
MCNCFRSLSLELHLEARMQSCHLLHLGDKALRCYDAGGMEINNLAHVVKKMQAHRQTCTGN